MSDFDGLSFLFCCGDGRLRGFAANDPTQERSDIVALDWFNAVFLYNLGRDLQALLQAAQERRGALTEPLIKSEIGMEILYTSDVMSQPLLPLPASQRAASALRGTLDSLREVLQSATMENVSQPVESRIVSEVKDRIVQFQTVLAADLGKAAGLHPENSANLR
ncbi:MAG TPA: hypothetical protein VMV15_10495 [Candidatus Binataceae bacterium]|nr:hypothetical protein [Candidatus Binataceae bacterium]